VVKLDADQRMPRVGLTLTTRSPDFDLVAFRRAVENLFRWLRRSFPEAEYLGVMEWTTGRRTKGRRPHMHALVKGVDPGVATELEAQVSARWLRYTSEAWKVECRPLRTPAGAIAYLTLHHHKREQAPPPGFRGKRLRPSKGYYSRPIVGLREEARAVLGDKRVRSAVVRAFNFEHYERQDVPEDLVDELLGEAIDRARLLPRAVLVNLVVPEVTRMQVALRGAESLNSGYAPPGPESRGAVSRSKGRRAPKVTDRSGD
jgi:hypothetical protein